MTALLFLIDPRIGRADVRGRHRLASVLCVEDRATEIARQRRPQLRHTRIVLWQTREPVWRRAIVGGIQLFVGLAAVTGLERIDERGADAGAGDESQPRQHFSRNSRHAGRFRTQSHRSGGFACQRQRAVFRLRRIFLRGFALAHDAGLPSVREIRTRFWFLSEPKRSSAAANNRSTIM